MNPEIRIGVIGTGSMGKNHARIFSRLDHAQFTAVLDQRPEIAKEIALTYGAKAFTELDDFAEHVDAATVATPTSTHFALTKALLERGKHVLVEKPFTETPEEARELCSIAQARGLVLQVGHIERFNPVLSALESHLTHPRFIEATRLSPYPGRSLDVGVVLDVMIHDLEIILHLVRSPVAQVDAVGVSVLSNREDIANVRLRFQNGCVAKTPTSPLINKTKVVTCFASPPKTKRKVLSLEKSSASPPTARSSPSLRDNESFGNQFLLPKKNHSNENSLTLLPAPELAPNPKSAATRPPPPSNSDWKSPD